MQNRNSSLEDPFEVRNTKVIDENIEINENLLKDKYENQYNPRSQSCLKTILYTIFPYCKKVDILNKKIVYVKDQYLNYTEFSNKIQNHKYNLITFIPIVLFNQFKQFGNFFYLILFE